MPAPSAGAARPWQSLMPLVKICGLSTSETVAAALAAGADQIGVVFFPRSPRYVSLQQARALADQARGHAEVVALVVDADDELLDAIVAEVAPDWLQLHGRETPDRVRAVKNRAKRPVMKAIGIGSSEDLAAAADFRGVADRLLFDAKPPKGAVLPGGNGVTFDWTILRGTDMPFMLSGGLGPDNVAEALRISGAPAVDVSSGVESAPGRKDPALITGFIRAARQAAPR